MTLRPLVLLGLAGALAGAPPQPASSQAAAPTDPAQAAARGLKWLLRAQNRDGSWGLDAQSSGDISCTVVAALAIMSNGNTERGGPCPDSVLAIRKALDFVLSHARRARADIWNGEATLVQNKLGAHVHTFFASVFLTQIYGMRGTWVGSDEAEELREHISQLLRIIVRSQEPDGSWHKETFGSLKATCMAWMALRSAAGAGFDVEQASVLKVIRFIKAQYNPASHLFDKSAGPGTYQSIYSTASCLRVLYAMGEGRSGEAAGATEAFLKFVKTGAMSAAYLTVEGEDYLSAALVTQALMGPQDARWNEWYPWITQELRKRQANDGSWTTTACIRGRTFATSCALLTLLAPQRYLPLLEQ